MANSKTKDEEEINQDEIPYEDRTIPELKQMASDRDVEIEPDARKDDIIKALEKADKKSGTTAKAGTKRDPKDQGDIKGHITIRGSESSDRRLFQTSPFVKEWLTQGEAEGKGHYWRDEEKLGKA